jgi:hypothetical protein
VRRVLAPAIVVVGALAYGTMILASPTWSSQPSGAWALAAEVATEPRYMFIIATAWLLRCLLRPDPLLPALVRLGSYRMAAARANGSAIRAASASILFATVAWFIACLMLGLPWSAAAPNDSAVRRFGEFGVSAPVGVVLQLALVALTLLALDLAITALRLAFTGSISIVFFALTVWVWIAAATLGFVPMSPLNAGFYLNASLGALFPRTAMVAVVVLVAALALSSAAIGELDRRARGDGIRWARTQWWFAVVTLGILALAMKDYVSGSLADGISLTLWGSGSIVQFATPVVIFVGYAWLFGVRLSRHTEGLLELELLRYGSRLRWGVRLFMIEAGKAVVFVVGLLVAAFTLYVLLGGRDFSAPAGENGGTAGWLFQFLVNGVLQLLVYLVLVFGANFVSRDRSGGIVIVGVLVVLAFMQSTPVTWLPVQLSGMVFSITGWTTILAATLTLFIALFLAAASLPVLFHWQKARS